MNINITIWSIKKDNDNKKKFIKSLMNSIKQLDITDIMSKEDLQTIVLQLATAFENAWSQHSKLKYITKHSKE